MKILITGPSCSGKSTFVKQRLNKYLYFPLDQLKQPQDQASFVQNTDCQIFEGIPLGKEQSLRKILNLMDWVIVLCVPFSCRFKRMLKRDGLKGALVFFFNEYAWRRFVRPTLKNHSKISFITLEISQDDPIEI